MIPDDDGDSLGPHLAAIARSRRVQAYALTALRWLAPMLMGSVAVPTFRWVETRYDRASAEALVRRVTQLERVTGLPPTPAEAAAVRSLQDQVIELRGMLLAAEQRVLEREYKLYSLLVVEASRGHARQALDTFERLARCAGEVGSAPNPYHCAQRPAEAAAGLLQKL